MVVSAHTYPPTHAHTHILSRLLPPLQVGKVCGEAICARAVEQLAPLVGRSMPSSLLSAVFIGHGLAVHRAEARAFILRGVHRSSRRQVPSSTACIAHPPRPAPPRPLADSCVGRSDESERLVHGVAFDYNDAESEWWTPAAGAP